MTGTLRNSRRVDIGGATMIGFILIMGVISMLVFFQLTQMIPQQADTAEFEAGLGVTEDVRHLGEVVNEIDGETGVRVVSIGEPVQYPLRGGNLYTEGTIVREASPEQQVLIEGRDKRFEASGSLVSFQGQYVYRNSERVVFEHGAVYILTEEGETVMLRDKRIVDGEQLTVHTLSSQAGSSTSQSTMAVSLYPDIVERDIAMAAEDNSGTIKIVLPTHRSEAYWTETYENELRSNGGYVSSIKYTEQTGEPNEVKFVMKGGDNYSLSWRVVELDD